MILRCLPFLLLLAGPAAAQQFAISLPPQTASTPLAAGSFQVAQVVDARADRTTLGFAQQGLDNHRVPANFPQGLEKEVLGFVSRLSGVSGGRPVVLRIHTLKITEETRASSERATAEVTADFLVQQGEQYYPLLAAAAGVETKGLDVTGQHAGNLAKVLSSCLAQLAALPATAQPAAGTAPLTWAQVQHGDGYQPYRFPIQKTMEPKRGFYRTFEEFQQDSPSRNTDPFEVVQTPRTNKKWAGLPAIEAYYLRLSATDQRTPVRGVWGFSDGHDTYIFQRGSYFQLTPTGTGYSFTGAALPDPNDVTTGAILGGLAGAAIVSATSNTGPMDYEMSVVTGNLQPRRAPDGFGAAADTAAVYLYRRADASPAEPLQVLVDGKAAGTLGPNQYLALTWLDRRRDMSICLLDAGKTCYTLLPIFGTATYLMYGQKKAADQPALQTMPAKEGAFHLRHLHRQPQ